MASLMCVYVHVFTRLSYNSVYCAGIRNNNIATTACNTLPDDRY